MTCRFSYTPKFTDAASTLPDETKNKLEKCLDLLSENPRHPSLRSHKVKGGDGIHGGDIFEAYIDKKYRLTWEYKGPGEILLRNCGNHDDCLKDA